MEVSSWQTELPTVRERNLYAFNKSLFCDVEFSVLDSNGDKVTLQAHRYVLAIGSPVFEAMFYGELAETGRTIDLPDCTKEGLQELLHYVYSDEVNLTGSNVMQVLYLAKKYMLPFLEQKCIEYLEKELKPEEVFTVLPQAKQLGDEKLEKHCWEIVDSETEQAVSSEPFLDVSHEVLCQFLGRDGLTIEEVQLFQAVDKWVLKRIEENGVENNRENKRAILGEEAIRLIRFPLMPLKVFAEIVIPQAMLKQDELSELIQAFSSVKPSTSFFSTQKRRFQERLKTRDRFNSFRSPSTSSWNYERGYIDAVDFTINKPVSLFSVQLFGSQGNSYDVDLSLYKGEDVVSQISSRFLTEDKMINDQYYGFTFILDKPVQLEPGVRYTIAAEIKGSPSFYGENGQASIECGDLVIKYFQSTKSANGTGVTSGQLATIIIAK